jgi:hypothetical protein
MSTATFCPRPTPSPGELRLTRRGRVVVTLLFLALVLVALTLFSGYSAATGTAGAPPPTRDLVVAEGDTLWSIAARVAGPGEIREVVHEIQELNSMPDPALTEGQRIAVPTR